MGEFECTKDTASNIDLKKRIDCGWGFHIGKTRMGRKERGIWAPLMLHSSYSFHLRKYKIKDRLNSGTGSNDNMTCVPEKSAV